MNRFLSRTDIGYAWTNHAPAMEHSRRVQIRPMTASDLLRQVAQFQAVQQAKADRLAARKAHRERLALLALRVWIVVGGLAAVYLFVGILARHFD